MRPKLSFIFFLIAFSAFAGQPLSLDSCRTMALANNKQLRIRTESIRSASYLNKSAKAAYLPAIDFTGGYTYNQKQISIFDSDQYLPIITNGKLDPTSTALIPKDAMTYDIRNLFFGALTVTQPVYMGGKIQAMNRITGYAEEIARALHDNEAEKVIYAVDAAYWQVVSLNAKQRLAQSYVAMLDTLRYNVDAMLTEGVATRSDLLSVSVRLNEAKVDQTKVDNALSLSKMALAHLCGLSIDSHIELADEQPSAKLHSTFDTQISTFNRPDIRALNLAVKIAEQQSVVARAEMLPSIALVGAYSFSNPNFYNGFQKKFDGAFSIGAMVSIPIWHWGGNYNRYRAARTDITIARLRLEDAFQKADLQVRQARFKLAEAEKVLTTSTENLNSADENLSHAQIGFDEGVLSVENVMQAQTAWLKARSEALDAEIDLHICRIYLAKALGILYF